MEPISLNIHEGKCLTCMHSYLMGLHLFQYFMYEIRKSLATVNLEIFAIILFSQIALKDVFAMLKIRD